MRTCCHSLCSAIRHYTAHHVRVQSSCSIGMRCTLHRINRHPQRMPSLLSAAVPLVLVLQFPSACFGLALACCTVWSICSRLWMALTQQSTSAGGGGEISQGRGRYRASCAGTGSGSTAGATAGAASTSAAAAVKLAGSGTPLEQTCPVDVEVPIAACTPSPMSLSVETGLRTTCPLQPRSARL